MSKINKFFQIYGWQGFVRLPFYPVTALLTTPVRMIQTLWECRVLADGRWKDFSGFSPAAGINFLFYRTTALNLLQFGIFGKSPYLGLGNFSLSRMFHYSLPSLYAFCFAGNVLVLTAMFGWWGMHLLWLQYTDTGWTLAVLFLVLISTTFYTNTFFYQNYNAWGWLFFPIGLFAVLNGHWALASLAWLLASFGSITIVLIAVLICVFHATAIGDLYPVMTFIPAGIKSLFHLWPEIKEGSFKASAFQILKTIGTTGKDVKYKRPRSVLLGVVHWYWVILYVQFGIASGVAGLETYLFWVGLAIWFLNVTFLRFADEQHGQVMMLSLAATLLLQNNEEWWLLVPFWILASPLPFLSGLRMHSFDVLDVVPKFRPFYIKPLVEGMSQFFKLVKKGQRVLLAFDNPNRNYFKIFDGYRHLIELPLYVASLRKIHVMPDWWGILETNHEGSPEFWGREVKEVLDNVKTWDADFVVVYQEEDFPLDPKWTEGGFEPLMEFRWKDYSDLLEGTPLPRPNWWLLKPAS